jgi:hypothetical protein
VFGPIYASASRGHAKTAKLGTMVIVGKRADHAYPRTLHTYTHTHTHTHAHTRIHTPFRNHAVYRNQCILIFPLGLIINSPSGTLNSKKANSNVIVCDEPVGPAWVPGWDPWVWECHTPCNLARRRCCSACTWDRPIPDPQGIRIYAEENTCGGI